MNRLPPQQVQIGKNGRTISNWYKTLLLNGLKLCMLIELFKKDIERTTGHC